MCGVFGTWSSGLLAQQPCGGSRSLTISPNPDARTPAGELYPDEVFSVCFTLDGYDDPDAVNWFHGVAFDFGSGWDVSAVQNIQPAPPCTFLGEWDWYPEVTPGNGGDPVGPGFFFDRGDGNPGSNFGDDDLFGFCVNHSWTFCFDIPVPTNATVGDDLSISARVLSDSESGNWTQGAGQCQDPPHPADVSAPLTVGLCPISVVLSEAQAPTCPDLDDGSLRLGFGPIGSGLILAEVGAQSLSVPPSGELEVTGLTAGNYTITLTELSLNCTRQISAEIPAPRYPQLLDVAVTDALCAGEPTGSLLIDAADASAYRAVGGAWQAFPLLSNLTDGTYTLELRGENGCITVAGSYTVGATNEPQAQAQIDAGNGLWVDAPIRFESLSSPADVALSWDMGNGDTVADSGAFSYRYPQAGTYTPRLLVTDAQGCTASWQAPQALRIAPFPPLKLPTAFSPNNDGLNDLWLIDYPFAQTLSVFDRNGRLLHQTTALPLQWDGTDEQNQDVPQGVYVGRVTFSDGRAHTVSITLLR